jgi:NADH-quinone oxidoreductase subunit M
MLALLLILIPLLTGLGCFFIRRSHAARIWAMVSALGSLAVSLAAILVHDNGSLHFAKPWIPFLGSGFSLDMDGLGKILCLLTGVAYPLVFLATWSTNYSNAKNYFGLMLLAQAGLMGVFLASDALLFYFFWELALIPMYFLCSQWGGERRIQATFKFFIYTFIGSVLMLIGIIYLQSKTPDHSFSIRSFYALQTILSPKEQTWIFWLFFIAFAIKMPVFPFHTWQPDTYEQAPTSVTMILSGVMVKMGLYGLIRWLLPVVSIGAYQWSDMVPPLALAGLVYASLIALKQDDLKRLVAYSSIAHMGFMCAACFSVNQYGMQGVMIQLFSHGINIMGLWIAVEFIERKSGTRKMSELGGLAAQSPSLAIFFVIIALANIALPLTNAFVGEFLMFNGLYHANTAYYLWWIILAGAGVILGAVYTLNMIRRVFYGENGKFSGRMTDIGIGQKLAFFIITALILWTGIYPKTMLGISEPASKAIIQKINEIKFNPKQ